MNKKISSELAIGVILLAAIALVGVSWMHAVRRNIEGEYQAPVIPVAMGNASEKGGNVADASDSEKSDQNAGDAACQSHYYEGNAQVKGWAAKSGNDNSNELSIEINSEDSKKLPATQTDYSNADLVVTLIDPTEKLRSDLQNSSQQKPVTLTIHGYAQVCQTLPQVSLAKASVAFKKKQNI